jgi:hypothetical protein
LPFSTVGFIVLATARLISRNRHKSYELPLQTRQPLLPYSYTPYTAMAAPFSTFSADGGDPRTNIIRRGSGVIAPQQRLLHDPAVTFEEYYYYAQRTRAEEDAHARADVGSTGILQILFPPKSTQIILPSDRSDNSSPAPEDEKIGERRRSSVNANLAKKETRMTITDEEWTNASRAMRTATWAACFYLITTDILGPFGVG